MSSKLTVVDRSNIIVEDQGSSRAAKEEGRDGKMAVGRSLTQTEESLYWCEA